MRRRTGNQFRTPIGSQNESKIYENRIKNRIENDIEKVTDFLSTQYMPNPKYTDNIGRPT